MGPKTQTFDLPGMKKTFQDKPMLKRLAHCPVLTDVIAAKPTLWINDTIKPFAQARSLVGFDRTNVTDAADRLERFRPYIARAFSRNSGAVVRGRAQASTDPLGHFVDDEDHLLNSR